MCLSSDKKRCQFRASPHDVPAQRVTDPHPARGAPVMGAPSHRQCGAKRLFLHVSSTDSVFRWITAGTGARDGDVIYTRREYEYKKHVLCPWVEDDACPQMRAHTHMTQEKKVHHLNNIFMQ